MQILFCIFSLLFATVLATPNAFAEFVAPILEDERPSIDNDTIAEGAGGFELVRRQGTCASNYHDCSNIGSPGLCCRNSEVCAADGSGNPACCPNRAVCTGTIGAVFTGQPTATTSSPFILVSTTTTTTIAGITGTATTTSNGFQQSGSAGVSWVSNTFFPFAFLPTTYANAAACSSAYSSCQSDAARCTDALANGAQGVTISGPNGGATITAVASLGSASASQVCSSLSQQACSGSWNVQACSSFGNGNWAPRATGCPGLYEVGAAMAVGVVGQMFR